jgi:preprotein translocase subunit YajC
VLIALFVLAGASHMFLFVRNNNRKPRRHKFVFSALLFGFCVTRVAALSVRIAWARDSANARLALAATVLTSAGVLLLFIVNIILTVRVVRATHPLVGWSKPVDWGLRVLIFTVVGVLVMVVFSSVHQLFTLNMVIRRRERDVMLFAGVYMAVVAVVPLVVMGLVRVLPRKGPYAAENFGKGSMATKMVLLAFTSTLLTLGAGFRAAVNFEAKPVSDPQWYHSRPAFYCFNFVIEITVVYTYLLVRFDQRFYVPDGSSKPGDYSRTGEAGFVEMDDRQGGSGISRDSVATVVGSQKPQAEQAPGGEVPAVEPSQG